MSSSSDTTEKGDSSEQNYTGKVVSAERICKIIADSAQDAAKNQDYVSFATVLDVNLKGSDRFTFVERQHILTTLYEVLQQNDELLYEVGWDIPAILMEYFKIQNGDQALAEEPCIKVLMKIFSLLAEKGNPKELYLKAIESLSNLRLSHVGEPGKDDFEDPNSIYSIAEIELSCKFYCIFELMQCSMTRIHTKYPSRFLATSTNALISFTTLTIGNLSWRGYLIILRRLYIFARDYKMNDGENVELSDSEVNAQQQLLRSYITWVVDTGLQDHFALWTDQLYYELKSQKCRDWSEKAELSHNANSLSEILTMIYELSMSFDMDLGAEFEKILDAPEDALLDDEESLAPESEEDADSSKDLKNPFANTSKQGILLLYTHQFFKERDGVGSKIRLNSKFAHLVTAMLQREGGTGTAGVIDAMTFWILWISRNVTKEEVQALETTEFNNLLMSLMTAAGALDSYHKKPVIVYTIATKLLYLQKDEITLDFMFDTLEHCPFENVTEATVRLLKDFIIRKKPAVICMIDNPDELADKVDKLSVKEEDSNNSSQGNEKSERIQLVEEKRDKIEELVDSTLTSIEEEGVFSLNFNELLSWLNFVTVIEINKKFLSKIIKRVEKVIENEQSTSNDDEDTKSSRQQKASFLQLSLDSIIKKWYNGEKP